MMKVLDSFGISQHGINSFKTQGQTRLLFISHVTQILLSFVLITQIIVISHTFMCHVSDRVVAFCAFENSRQGQMYKPT